MNRGPLAARVADLIALDLAVLSLAVAGALAVAGIWSATALAVAVAIVAAHLAGFALAGGYRLAGARTTVRAAARRALVVSAGIAALVAVDSRIGLRQPWPAAAGAFAALALLAPLVAAGYLRLLRRGWLDRRVLVVGSGPLADRIAAGVRAQRALGLRFAGHVAARPGTGGALHPYLGPVEHLEKVLREFAIEWVVLAADADETAPAEDALVAARVSGIAVESGADCYEWLYRRLPLDASRRQLFLEGPGFFPPRRFDLAKRAIDVALAVVGLLATAPLVGLAALAIRAESPGPAFFHQVRIGRYGQPFWLWKLRSMRDGAEDEGPALSEEGDPRVTRVGRLLRRARIDELPQLWNVLRGEMSVVGPRPERPEFYDELVGRYPLFRLRLAVRPGLTGWAQVQQGYVNDWEGFGVKLSYDLYYLKRRCLGLDAAVIWRTVGEMLRLKGV